MSFVPAMEPDLLWRITNSGKSDNYDLGRAQVVTLLGLKILYSTRSDTQSAFSCVHIGGKHMISCRCGQYRHGQ